MGSRGGGGAQNVTSQVTQTNLPAYVQPYFEDALQRGLFESARPYQPYGGQRMAQFAPEETAAQRNVMGMERPGQIQTASNIIGQLAGDSGPNGFNFTQQFNPGASQIGYQPTQFNSGYGATTFNPGYQVGRLDAQFDPGSLADPGAIASYMSPYQQAVTDIQRRQAMRASEAQRMDIGAQAARTGAMGSNRAAILEAERQRNLGQQLNDIQATGSQSAFDRATQAFEADRAARLNRAQLGIGAFQAQEGAYQQQGAMGMQAQQLADASRQRAAEFGLSAQGQSDQAQRALQEFRQRGREFDVGAMRDRFQMGLQGMEGDRAGRQLQLQAADLMGGLGRTQQELDLQRFGAMGSVGQQRRELFQRGLDTGYDDFLRQQAYPREQLGFFSNLLQGVPVQPGSTVSTYGNSPSAGQQALGAGLGALGLWQAYGGRKE